MDCILSYYFTGQVVGSTGLSSAPALLPETGQKGRHHPHGRMPIRVPATDIPPADRRRL